MPREFNCKFIKVRPRKSATKISKILGQYKIKHLKPLEIADYVEIAFVKATADVENKIKQYALKVLLTGYFWNQTKRKWERQRPVRPVDIRRISDFVRTKGYFMASKTDILISKYLDDLCCQIATVSNKPPEELLEKIKHGRFPVIDKIIYDKKITNIVVARLCDFLTKFITKAPQTKSKLNERLGPAADATREILELFGIITNTKAIKDAYHRHIPKREMKA